MASRGSSGHTPGPWRWEPEGIDFARKETAGVDVMAGPADDPICVAGDVRNEADAKLIVRAVNAHDAMLEALRAVAAETTEGARPSSTDSWLPPEIADQVRAAIAKAEERS